MNQKYEKAKFSDVFKYSFGGLGSNLAFFLVMSFLTFFYTDIFGISSYVVATLMLISRFIDAFTDPIMGMLGDNTRSKMGKYRPWIIFGAPVLGVLIFLLFTAPEMSPTMKVVYAYVIYILYSLASTVVNIPYHALTPVLSEDPQQRTEIVAWKQGMGTVSQFVITILALPLVELFGGGKQGWALYGALIGIMTTVSFWICAWGGKKYDKVDVEVKKEKFNLKENLQLLACNKPMLMLMIAFGTDVLANATYSAVNMYYFKYVLGREDLVSPVATAILVGSIISIPLLPPLTKLIGKKEIILVWKLIVHFTSSCYVDKTYCTGYCAYEYDGSIWICIKTSRQPWLGNAAGMFRLRRMEIWKTRRWFIIFFFNIYQQIWHGNWRIYRKLFPWISWIRGKSGSVTSGYQYDRILKIRDANLRIYRILNFHVLL